MSARATTAMTTIQHAMDLSPRRFADTVVLTPRGRIDHATAGALEAALAPYLERCGEGEDRLVLDLSHVEYIASVGLRVLMVAAKQGRARGGTVAVAALQPVVREIFEISKFTLVLPTFGSVREALSELSTPAQAAFDAVH